MSQVRKFDKGGETAAPTKQESSTAKTYKLIINGREINLDQDGLADFRKAGSGQGGTMGNVYADIADALESGHTVKYNSDSNTISGVDFKRIDPKAIFKANENQVWDRRAQRRANRYARNNNLTHQFNSALASIGSINFEKRKEESSDSDSSGSLTSLYNTDPRQFDYNKGEDGTLTWSSGPQNAGNLTALNNFIDMLGMSEEDAKKKYSWTGYDDQIRDLRSWYTGNQNYDWEELKSRIRENQLTENDWDLLRYMGFGESQSSSDSDSSSINTPRSYEGSGFDNNALEQAGYYVKKDKDGNVYLYDNNGQVVRDNIYLKGSPWANGTQWENGAVYQGRLWTNDQIMNQNNVASQAIRSLFDAMNAAQDPEAVRQAALNSDWTIYGMNNTPTYETFNAKSNYLNGFNDLFNNGNYYWNDITGNYNLGDNTGTRILSFYNTGARNQDGTFEEQYAVSDGNGHSKILDSIDALQNYLNQNNITNYEGYNPYKAMQQYSYEMYNGDRYVLMKNPINIGGKDFDIYRVVGGKNDGNYAVKNQKGEMMTLYGKTIMDAIKNGTATHQNLLDGRINPESKWWHNSIRKWTNSQNQELYQQGSYDDFFNYYKNGGKITKHQFGGLMSTGKSGSAARETSKTKVGESQKVFGTPKELKTSADKLANTSAILDTAGAWASFIPVYGNIAGAVTGLAGSLTRFVSDAKRDGLDWGDARRLLTNVGLDVLTLIPGAGIAAKAAKVGKTAKATKVLNAAGKVLRSTAKPLSVAGTIGGAATAIGAVADGDGEFTSEDAAQLGQGLLGMAGGIKNISNLNKEARLVKEIAKDIKVGEVHPERAIKTLKWYKRPGVRLSNKLNEGKAGSANNWSSRWLAYNPSKQDEMLAAAIKKGDIDLKKLATDKKGNLDKKHLADLENVLGKYLNTTGQSMRSGEFTITGQRINPWWQSGNQFGLKSEQAVKLLPAWKGPDVQPPIAPEVRLLSAWNAPKGNINPIDINGPIVTPPRQGMLQLPQYASSYQNAQGQLLLPRGNGRFFKRTQRVWNGGPAHTVNPIQPAKYSRTPSKSTKRNIGLEQAHKQKVLQEAGRQQVPAIRGLQEDIAKVRTSEDFKNLLIKINNRNSYKEIVKNNPEIKDQLRQMFVHLDPVRLGNWMTKYNLRFKQGGKIVKAQPGTKMPFGTFVQDKSLADPNLYDYSKSGIQFNGNDVDWTKTYGQGLFTDLRNYYLNNWDTEAFRPIRDAYLSQLSTGNNNVDLANFTKDDFSRLTQDQKLGYAHNLWTDQLRDYLYDTGDIFKMSGMNINNNKDTFVPYLNSDGTPMTMQQTYDYLIGRGVPEEQVKEYVSRNASKFANSYDGTELEAATVTASNDSGGSQIAGGQEIGSPVGEIKSGKGFNWNPDDLIGLANLGYSVHKNNQMYGVLENSIKDAGKGLMKEMPTEIYDRYQDHITPVYQEAANAKRQWTPISTDPLLNYSMRQANEDAAQALLTEGRLKASEQYTNYLDKDLAARRMYADQRRQIADANRATLANIIMQLGQNDAARRLANNQSVQNYVGEMRTKFAQDRQKVKQFQLQDAQVRAQNAYSAKYNELGNKWMQEFNTLSDTEKEKYGTWENYWQTKDINDYNNAIEQASITSRNIMQDFYPNQLDYFRYRPSKLISPASASPTVYYGKKGGKTPTYLKRHTGQKPDEAIWIQRNKDTAKALEKLHDAVIKLFMKALS